MRDKEFIEGDCFIYTIPNSLKSKFGFIVITKKIKKDKTIKYIYFALVMIPENTDTLNEFKEGYIYTHQVGIGSSGLNYKTGIFCYDFNKDTIGILDKFGFIGNLEIDASKFIIGSGSGGEGPEWMFNADLKNKEVSMANHFKRANLESILQI